MTSKERLHILVDELSEPEAERALKLVEKEHEDREPADEVAKPGDIIDDWGNLSAMKRSSTRRLMRRMAEEEAAAGLDPW